LLGLGQFTLLGLNCCAPEVTGVAVLMPEVTAEIRSRYLGDQDQALYLIRPDQVVAARWLAANASEIDAALAAAWEGH
jgi:3-(3-hydroxy-phenyl)propionate hydroxylase